MRSVLAIALVAASLSLTAQQPAPAPAAAPSPDALRIANMSARLNDYPAFAHYRAANAALPANAPGRVVFMGDSITDFWVRNGGKFFPGKPYVNRGISGQTTQQMLLRFRADVVALHPETVVILAGTNDIAGNAGPSTLEMIEDNIQSMTEIARANQIRVILSSVLPAAKYGWNPSIQPAEKIKALNTWIADYSKQQHITYLNYYDQMVGENGGMKPGISLDGVHPNAAGYAIMEPLAEKALASIKVPTA